jgi:hypothetical protein
MILTAVSIRPVLCRPIERRNPQQTIIVLHQCELLQISIVRLFGGGIAQTIHARSGSFEPLQTKCLERQACGLLISRRARDQQRLA